MSPPPKHTAIPPRKHTAPTPKKHPSGPAWKYAPGEVIGTPDGANDWFYLDPRAYPLNAIDPGARAQAVEKLQAYCVSVGYTPSPPPGTAWSGAIDPAWSTCLWHSAGPTNLNGRVMGLAIDPANEAHVFAATVGGLWRSLDGAQTWQRVSDDFGAICFGAVAVAPDAAGLVVAGQGDPNRHEPGSGAGGYGIYISTAGGAAGTWTRFTIDALRGTFVTHIRVGPGTTPSIYVATSVGLYVGTPSGSGWSFALLKNMDSGCSDVVVNFQSSPPVVYAAVNYGTGAHQHGRGVWTCEDSPTGSDWFALKPGLPTTCGTMALALGPDSPPTLYARVSDLNGDLDGTYRFAGAAGWKNIDPGPDTDDSNNYSDYNSVIAVDPLDAGTVYVGGKRLYRGVGALSGPATWTVVDVSTEPGYEAAIAHVDKHAIVFLPSAPHTLLIADDGGIDRSTDLSQPTYHWLNRSHGMTTAEFYRVATQNGPASADVGGVQDNGTLLTFGNLTWYSSDTTCDGSDAGLEPAPSATVERFCVGPGCPNVRFEDTGNPVTGTLGAGESVDLAPFPTGVRPCPPIATWSTATGGPGPALVAACTAVGRQQLWDTPDGLTWTMVPSTTLPNGTDTFSAMGVGTDPATGTPVEYVGYRGNPQTSPANVWARRGTGAWTKTATGLPDLSPNAIAVDATDPNTAYAALGGGGGMKGSLRVTTDGGATWSEFNGPGSDAAFTAPLTGVAIDAKHPKVLYVSSMVGVFKVDGSTSSPVSAAWTPMLDGLTSGLDITSLALNQDRHQLVIGTLGYGAYTYDLDATRCKLVALGVRDNVFDDGFVPSPYDVRDPEHPIVDATRPAPSTGSAFYVSQSDPGHKLYWWTSPDIRFHRDDAMRPQNELEWADNVGVESCPTEAGDCAPGTNVDEVPGRNETDLVYVQVTNRGPRTASGVRVRAMWADATTGTPDLPADFWSVVFPASGPCSPPSPSSGWHDFNESVLTVPDIPADGTQVATFSWTVPAGAPDHSCVLAFAECPDDPIPARVTNDVVTRELVAMNAEVGQRNLHLVDSPPGSFDVTDAESLSIGNPTSDPTPVDLYFASDGIPDTTGVGFMLPSDPGLVLKGITRIPTSWTGHLLGRALAMHADTSAVYQVDASTGSVRGLSVPPHGKRTIGFAFSTHGTLPPGNSARFAIVERRGSEILGGSVYVLRSRKR